MKNLFKVLALSFVVGLFGVVAVSSMLANPSEVQTPQTSIKFDVETGIRWNPSGVSEDVGAFEVFNTNGIAYIASNVWVDAAGEVASDGDSGFYQATQGANYKIMQDIPYTVPTIEANTRDEIKDFFNSGVRRTLTSTAIVYGRSCTLSNFPIVNGALLFESNAGTISNLRIENPTFSSGGTGVGLIARTNAGTIKDCIIEEKKSGDLEVALDVGEASIGVIAYSNSGSAAVIRNNTSYLDIVSQGAYAAGIVAISDGGNVFGNVNHGDINNETNYSTHAAGIIAKSDDNAQILSNANHAGTIVGGETACGVLASNPPYANHSNISANNNSTEKTSIIAKATTGETAEIYIGMPASSGDGETQEPMPDPIERLLLPDGVSNATGIYYYGDVNGKSVFLIDKAAGLSKIGDGKTYNTQGAQVTSGSYPRAAASTSSEYYIAKPISDASAYSATIAISGTTVVDGQGFQLSGFPIKSTGSALFSSIATDAIVRNIDITTSSTTVTVEGGVIAKSNSGTIDNCKVSMSITSVTARFGGVCHTNYGTIMNCTTYGDVKTSSWFGGMACSTSTSSNAQEIFFNCVNEISIKMVGFNASVGGIVRVVCGRSVVVDCVNRGSITTSWEGNSIWGVYIGGIVALMSGDNGELNPLPNFISSKMRFSLPFGVVLRGVVVLGCFNVASIHNGSSPDDVDVNLGGIAGMFTQSVEGAGNILYCGNDDLGNPQTTLSSGEFSVNTGGLVGFFWGRLDRVTTWNIFGYNRMLVHDRSIIKSYCVGGIVGLLGGYLSDSGVSSVEISFFGPCTIESGNVPVKGEHYTDVPFSIGRIGFVNNYPQTNFIFTGGGGLFPELDTLDISYQVRGGYVFNFV